MKVRDAIVLVTALLACSSCITTSGVFDAGKDTYSVVQNGNGAAFTGKAELMKGAFAQANAYCKERGKVMQPISTSYNNSGLEASYELTFRALDPNDQEYGRPTLEKVPDAKIEIQQNRN